MRWRGDRVAVPGTAVRRASVARSPSAERRCRARPGEPVARLRRGVRRRSPGRTTRGQTRSGGQSHTRHPVGRGREGSLDRGRGLVVAASPSSGLTDVADVVAGWWPMHFLEAAARAPTGTESCGSGGEGVRGGAAELATIRRRATSIGSCRSIRRGLCRPQARAGRQPRRRSPVVPSEHVAIVGGQCSSSTGAEPGRERRGPRASRSRAVTRRLRFRAAAARPARR